MIGPVKVFRLHASKMMTLARVVKCIYSEHAVLALMHVLPCHVSKSEARSLENVEVATLVFEACCMTDRD